MMIDGCTFRLYFASLSILHNDQKFKFKAFQIGIDEYYCKYRGLRIKLIYSSNCCVIHGSLHKFKNYGKTNKDLLTIKQLIETMKMFYNELHMTECSKIEFQGIEFGVNVELGYNPQIFIDYIIKIKGFKFMEGGVRFESEGNYEFKIYFETIKVPIPEGHSSLRYKEKYVLRFEIKLRKMEAFDRIMSASYFPKINKFSDIIDLDVFRILGNYLLEEFDYLMVWDRELVDKTLFKGKKLELFMNGCRIAYWDNFSTENPTGSASRDKKRFIKLLDANSSIKSEIRSLMINAMNQMLDVTEEDINDFYQWLKDKPDIYPLKLDEETKK